MRQLDRILGQADSLQSKLPAALHILQSKVDHAGDIKARDYASAKVSGGKSELTPTEAAAEQLLANDVQRTYILGLLDAAEKALEQARQECDHTIRTRTPAPRCTGGTGRDGAIEWGRPDCWEVPARGALCIACYFRERRWRQDHHLPTRDAD